MSDAYLLAYPLLAEHLSPDVAVIGESVIVFDSLIFVLTLFKALSSRRDSHRIVGVSNLTDIILYDGAPFSCRSIPWGYRIDMDSYAGIIYYG